jgi:hypothetical protein
MLPAPPPEMRKAEAPQYLTGPGVERTGIPEVGDVHRQSEHRLLNDVPGDVVAAHQRSRQAEQLRIRNMQQALDGVCVAALSLHNEGVQ